MMSPVDDGLLGRVLLDWYARSRRDLPWRRTDDPYAVWVSEVMLQQTQVTTVIPYYLRFLDAYPTVERLAQSDLEQVLKLWEGLGYYSRARNLHKAAGLVVSHYGGRIPDNWDTLRRLPGIGDYIGAAVLSIAYNRPYAVVDGNVKRVLARVFTLSDPVNASSSHKIFQQWANRLLDLSQPGDYNQAVMELGALICLPRQPLCAQCPLKSHCQAHNAGATERFPVRIRRTPVPKKTVVAAVIRKGDRLLLVRRPAQGLLGGLWELPNAVIEDGEEPASACARMAKDAVDLDVEIQRRLSVVQHAYTHFKIRMHVFECRYLKGRVRLDHADASKWIAPAQAGGFALHKAMLKAWPAIEKAWGG